MTRETLLQSILTEIRELRDITNDTSIRGMTEDMREWYFKEVQTILIGMKSVL